MKTRLQRFYIAYIAISVLACGICGIIEVHRFKKEKNFSRDLRIPLPEYSIITEKFEKYVDPQTLAKEGDNVNFVKKSFCIELEEPLSVKAMNILFREERGWVANGQEGYCLWRRKGNDEHLFAATGFTNGGFYQISMVYEYGHPYGGYPMYAVITFSILMCLLLIIWSIIELVSRIRLRSARTEGE